MQLEQATYGGNEEIEGKHKNDVEQRLEEHLKPALNSVLPELIEERAR